METIYKTTNDGVPISVHELCRVKKVDYRKVIRRVKAGIPLETAINYKNEKISPLKRSGTLSPYILTPSDVIKIYTLLFNKVKSQTKIANEYGIHPSTVSDIWRHKRWGWLTSPIRYELEQK